MEWSPADGKNYHKDNWCGERGEEKHIRNGRIWFTSCTGQRVHKSEWETSNINYIHGFKTFAILSVLPLPTKRKIFPLIVVLDNPMNAHRVTFKQSRKQPGNVGECKEAKPIPGSENQAGSKVQFGVM